MAVIAGILTSLLKGYVAKLATQEFAHWVLMQLAEAIVKSTKTKEDDRWLEEIRRVIEK